MNHASLLKQLLPYQSYDPYGKVLAAQLAAEGAALDTLNASTLMLESDPRTCYSTLDDWERVAGLPDICAGTAVLNVAARQQRLSTKLMTKGGASVAWLINAAAQMGYVGISPSSCVGSCIQTVPNQGWLTIDTFALANCIGDCLQPLYSQDWVFVFRLNLPIAVPIHFASAKSSVIDALATWTTGELACRIDKIKPAHTFAILKYL